MKEHVSFSNEDAEKTSLNFFELRQKGLEYLQEQSGKTWTDFNAHDPGVTILEQLCYGLTDVSLRSSFSIQDLLSKKNTAGKQVLDYKKNGFFAPPEIFSTHPVTEIDTKKLLLDNFHNIQNVWIEYTDNSGLEEKMVITKKIEILPKTIYNSVNPESLKKEIGSFLAKHRNLAEDVEAICVLKPRQVSIELEVELLENKAPEETIANILLDLLEHIYVPIRRYTLEELRADDMEVWDIFSGPNMSYGFIKNNSFKDRVTVLKKEKLEQVLQKRDGSFICKVKKMSFENEEESKDGQLEIADTEYFDVLSSKDPKEGEDPYGLDAKPLSLLLNNITVRFGKKVEKLKPNEKHSIDHLFHTSWTKKYRPYKMSENPPFAFNKIKGSHNDMGNYYSIQNQFPSIYAIGTDGLPQSVSEERKAKAKQLKAYLLLFEQHLANEIAQISHLGEFFDLKYNARNKRTYYTQDLSNVPNIKESGVQPGPDSTNGKEPPNEQDQRYDYDRKNRIFDHLLARFGENFDPTPFQIRGETDTNKPNDVNLNNSLLAKKSDYLQNIVRHSADGLKGESFIITNKENWYKRDVSGLENMILAKTNLSRRENRGAENNVYDTCYIVDHIMLRDFLDQKDVKYGFKFVDALEKVLCSTKTKEEKSWSEKQKEREERIENLFKKFENYKGLFTYAGALDNGYHGKILKSHEIKDDKNAILATFEDHYVSKNQVLSLMNLFDTTSISNRRLRYSELEEIRHKGIHIHERGHFGQRRLIYQRKLKIPNTDEEVTIDEDFFNLSISVVIPASKKTNKNQFEAYLRSLIIERIPSHIRVFIYFLKNDSMNKFRKKYCKWEKEKVKWEKEKVKYEQSEKKSGVSDQLKKDSYEVYEFLQGLKEKQRKNQEKEADLNKLKARYNKLKSQFDKLMNVAKDENMEVEKRLKSIEKLNQQVSQYNNQLSLGNVKSQKIEDLTTEYLKNLFKNEMN